MYLDQARSLSSKWSTSDKQNADEAAGVNPNMTFDSYGSNGRGNKSSGSVVSISSGLAQSARQIVGTFNCAGMNDRSGPLVDAELNGSGGGELNHSLSSTSRGSRPPSSSRRGRSNTRRDYPNGQQQQQQQHRPQPQYH